MNGDRNAFLERVRQAVRAGNTAGRAGDVPPRGQVGYQGDGGDPVGKFSASLHAAGGAAHLVTSPEGARRKIVELIENRSARRILLDGMDTVLRLGLADLLRGLGLEVWQESADGACHGMSRAAIEAILFAADVGVTGVNALIAETGSLVLHAQPGRARSLSLLPPLHIAVAWAHQIVPDLFDYFDAHRQAAGGSLPTACITLVTGPSKTGDIELNLVTGVHGPGELHVVIIAEREKG